MAALSATRMRRADLLLGVAILAGSVALLYPVFANRKKLQEIVPVRGTIKILESQSLGSPAAPVAVIEYSDFYCPFCERFSKSIRPALVDEFVNSGRVLWVFKHSPLTDIHPMAFEAAKAAYCAGEEERFWPVEVVFFSRPALMDIEAMKIVAGGGTRSPTVNSCFERRAGAAVGEQASEAIALGFNGTPSFAFGRLDASGAVDISTGFSGTRPKEVFADIINGLLNRKR